MFSGCLKITALGFELPGIRLLKLPAIIWLTDPSAAFLANILHWNGLDVITSIGQVLPTGGCDWFDWLRG